MYDHIAATSIPSEIHLISSSAMLNAHEQYYNQTFGSLADVANLHHYHHHNHHQLLYQQHNQHQHQKLRDTKSSTTTMACNQDHQTFQSKQKLRSKAQQRPQHHTRNYQSQQTAYNNATSLNQPQQHQQYLSIEELKSTRNSCWLCGCNWQEDHVSLDCPECDGYALSRPCPSCDGKCKQIWQRNISATHDKHRALWIGRCAFEDTKQHDNDEEQIDLNALQNQQATTSLDGYHNSSTNFRLLASSASSLCSSHPSSAASSDDEPDDFLSI